MRPPLPSLVENWAAAIAVPARNEEERLPRLLQALNCQTWAQRGRKLPVTIVTNNCTDNSAGVVRDVGGNCRNLQIGLVEVDFPEAEAHVGSARRLAMQRALAAMPQVNPRMALLTTDADAVPEPEWVEANLAALEEGADLVGGLLIGDAAEEASLGVGFQRRAALQARYAELADHLTALIDPLPHDPWPRHHDHTGASLAIRGNLYHAIGGLPLLPFREDLGLVARARAAGLRLRHDLAVRVGVSARLDGRAPGGMADTIKAWVAADVHGALQLVEAPRDVDARARKRAALRRLKSSAGPLAQDAALDPALREAALQSGLEGIALIEAFVPDEPDAPGTVPVQEAIAQLRSMIASRETSVAAA